MLIAKQNPSRDVIPLTNVTVSLAMRWLFEGKQHNAYVM